MSTLEIRGLRAAVGGKEILHGIDLTVRTGEVHAVMGPNGAGKSTLSAVVMGRPGYEVVGGTVTLDGTDVPGVRLDAALAEALKARGLPSDQLGARLAAEAERIGFDARFLDRPLNV